MNPAAMTNPQPADPLLTTKEVAALLSVPVSWVYDHVGLLPAFRIGKSLRFRASELEDWLDRQREGAPRYSVR